MFNLKLSTVAEVSRRGMNCIQKGNKTTLNGFLHTQIVLLISEEVRIIFPFVCNQSHALSHEIQDEFNEFILVFNVKLPFPKQFG